MLREFLETIVYPSKERLLEIRIIGDGKAKSFFFSSIDEVFSFLSSYNFNKSNVYYGILPRKMRSGNKEAVIDFVDVSWVDLDVLNVDECRRMSTEQIKEKCLEAYYRACDKLLEHGITPTAGVFTGHGVQILFKLSHEVPKEEIEQLNSILISFLSEFRADNKAKDCARVLRLPGFTNWKDPEKPIRAEILELNSEAKVDPTMILSLPVERSFESISHTGENSPSPPSSLLTSQPSICWKRLDRETKERIAAQISEVYKKGHRQSLIFHFSGYLAKSGVHPSDCAEIVHRIVSLRTDEEVKDRFEAVAWSYGRVSTDKEVINAIHEFARLHKIEKKKIFSWVKSASKGDSEKLRGSYNQLREEIKQILRENGKDEDEASTIAIDFVSRLEELVGQPVEKSVIGVPVKISKFGKGFRISFVNNPDKGIAKVKYPLDGWEVLEYDYITSFCIKRVRVLADPSTGDREYIITIRYPGKEIERVSPPLKVEELVEWFKEQEGIRKLQILRDAVSSLLDAFETKGRAEVKYTSLATGFVEVDGKLEFFNYESSPVRIPEPSREGLRKALTFLDELAKKYNHADGFVAGVLFGLVQPLGYVKRQNHVRSFHLVLTGEPKTGKSTVGDVILAMWGCPKKKPFYVSGQSIKSVARLGSFLDSTSLVVSINEVRDALTIPEISDMLKNARSELTIRDRYEGKNRIRTFHARASVFMTTNYLPMLRDKGLIESLLIFEFTVKQKPSKEERDEFAKWFSEIEKDLAYIGAWLIKTYTENWEKVKPHIMKEDFIEPGRKVLRYLYAEAGLEVPEWVDKPLQPVEIEEEIDELDLIVSTIKKDILQAVREVGVNLQSEGMESWAGRIEELKRLDALPEYLETNKDLSRIYIKPAIIEAVRRRTGYEIAGGLKNLADKYNLRYDKTPDKRKRAIVVFYDEFLKLLGEADNEEEEKADYSEYQEIEIDMTKLTDESERYDELFEGGGGD